MEFGFIDKIIGSTEFDLGTICFSADPDGEYLHIGHAFTLFLLSEIKKKYNYKFVLRFDDITPNERSSYYCEYILRQLEWLNIDFDQISFASEYLEVMYEKALQLISQGDAYVCKMSHNAIKEERGNYYCFGYECEDRMNSISKNKLLFNKMIKGDFEAGECVLRAKTDMLSQNVLFRDPILFRVINKNHYKYKDKWHAYPLYSFAEPFEDVMDNISHIILTSNYRDTYEIYNWVLKKLNIEYNPKRIEYGRIQIEQNTLNKNQLNYLVREGYVDGWADPRLYTIESMKNRNFSPINLKKYLINSALSKNDVILDGKIIDKFMKNKMKFDYEEIVYIKIPFIVKSKNKDGSPIFIERDVAIDIINCLKKGENVIRGTNFGFITFCSKVCDNDENTTDLYYDSVYYPKNTENIRLISYIHRCKKAELIMYSNILKKRVKGITNFELYINKQSKHVEEVYVEDRNYSEGDKYKLNNIGYMHVLHFKDRRLIFSMDYDIRVR